MSVARGEPCATDFGGKRGSRQGWSVVEGVKERLAQAIAQAGPKVLGERDDPVRAGTRQCQEAP